MEDAELGCYKHLLPVVESCAQELKGKVKLVPGSVC